ncbi:MAG: roadblock/LC7 domain-containing protein [Proteobacteria bacterium]|nr:roadblock/LC7 domain-containing protein [Pseudomonadota bacterium]MBU1389582.1 roadblock/LC7 domain-containing protein [Pseudomonadota bacterium]MBU1544446.1 roadblock/LC7 domain-containing protein [Pseudomonadota bacterium]MBU2429129.1 roadblock/LC7 domain-containing protein [Pseudomonadota bacterium]MBU2479453.1 roadblock/LC7 domain-containing protein [Pseudomonadota bacterium]
MLNQSQLDAIDQLIIDNLIQSGLDHVIFMDMAGNTIAKHDNGQNKLDSTAFAALAAGNFAAVDAMAKLVGESEFSLLFHKGEKSSIHFSKVNEENLLISMFNKDISLGLVRLKVAQTIEQIDKILTGDKS